ncbi:WD repeat-containing protein 7-like isoform X2 [Cotesia glomerata]|uniref:WD repeat-containing protein 7-like isoform X2 n=1 Tax=Cotesia glomerata TaxID=32391 RepID=UPI001D0277E0|nr:WD repeat-containing protein 7-like isoform X2 [Cotesia glomerata]
MIVECSDGADYVWQMESRHLDRVLHRIIAEEVLFACSDNSIITGDAAAGGEHGLANSTVHVLRGLRHRNLSAIQHATQRGLHQLQQLHSGHGDHHESQLKTKDYPLNIERFRGNVKDHKGHILFFNVEALQIWPYLNSTIIERRVRLDVSWIIRGTGLDFSLRVPKSCGLHSILMLIKKLQILSAVSRTRPVMSKNF